MDNYNPDCANLKSQVSSTPLTWHCKIWCCRVVQRYKLMWKSSTRSPMAVTCLYLSTPPLLSVSNKTLAAYPSLDTRNLAPTLRRPCLTLSTCISLKATFQFQKIRQNRALFWRAYAGPEEALTSDTTQLENSQQMVSASGDASGTIIQALLFVAFVGLSILTIGVIYLGVTDFLQKREGEKFEKEEATKKKNKRRGKVRPRTGPRGFGQKIDEDDEFDI